jgi:hypothetical protein
MPMCIYLETQNRLINAKSTNNLGWREYLLPVSAVCPCVTCLSTFDWTCVNSHLKI